MVQMCVTCVAMVLLWCCRYHGAEEDDGEARAGKDTLGTQEDDC